MRSWVPGSQVSEARRERGLRIPANALGSLRFLSRDVALCRERERSHVCEPSSQRWTLTALRLLRGRLLLYAVQSPHHRRSGHQNPYSHRHNQECHYFLQHFDVSSPVWECNCHMSPPGVMHLGRQARPQGPRHACAETAELKVLRKMGGNLKVRIQENDSPRPEHLFSTMGGYHCLWIERESIFSYSGFKSQMCRGCREC
jgi:hypothetical protein